MRLLYVEQFRKMNLRSPVRLYIHIATIRIFDLSEPLSRGSERTEYVLNERTLSNTVRMRAKRVFNRLLVQNVFYHRSPRPGTLVKSLAVESSTDERCLSVGHYPRLRNLAFADIDEKFANL